MFIKGESLDGGDSSLDNCSTCNNLFLIPTSYRRPGEESDAESSRETSSDGSSDNGVERRINAFVEGTWNQQKIADANVQSFSRLSLRNRPFVGSSSDESELMFEYFEHDPPFSREPLADKASELFFYRRGY